MHRLLRTLVFTQLALALHVVALPPQPAAAATIELDRDGNISLTGEIVKGDAERLRSVIERHGVKLAGGDNRMLVLSSPGGNLEEANQIISVFWQGRNGGDRNTGPLATVVPAGAQCLSSCALIFMHGQDADIDEGAHPPSRWIHATAVLGFHRPFFVTTRKDNYTDDELNRGIMVGHRLLDRIMSRDAIPRGLMNVFMEYDRNEYFDIKTARQATTWQIGVFLRKPQSMPKVALTPDVAYTACYRFQYAAEDDTREPNAAARNYASYTGSNFRDRVTRKTKYKDAFGRHWRGVFEVQVEHPEGSFDCYAWTDPKDESGRVYLESDGSEATQLDWTYLMPPGLPLRDTESFLAALPAAPQENAGLDSEKDRPEPQAIVKPEEPPSAAPPAVGPPIAESRRGVVCNTQSGYADIRLHPSPGELPIDKIRNNTAITLNGAPTVAGGQSWYLVRFSSASGTEKLGYVSASDVAVACSVAEPAPAPVQKETGPEAPPPVTEPASRQAMVCNAAARFARVRRGPAPDFAQVTTLDNGTSVMIVGEKNNPLSGQLWYEIEFATGVSTSRGYMDGDYVKDSCGPDGNVVETPAPGSGPSVTESNYVVCNRASPYSNVRAGPAKEFDAVGSINNHDTVTVIDSANNPKSGWLWYRIEFKEHGTARQGYVDSSSLSVSCDLPPNTASQRIVCNAKSAYSNVRRGPGKSYQVIDKVYNGDRVWVTRGHRSQDTNHLWFGIAYGENDSGEGFIDSDVALVDCPASVIAGAR